MVEGMAEDAEQQKQIAEVINEEAGRMRGLVDDLLYLSRIESGELELKLDQIDFDALVAAGVRRARFAVDGSEVAVRQELDGGRLTGDERRLEQVLANLLDNAIRFATAGSEVAVRSYGGRRTRWWSRSATGASRYRPRTSSRCSTASIRWTRRAATAPTAASAWRSSASWCRRTAAA